MNFTQERGNFLDNHLQEAGKNDDEKGMKNAFLIPFTMSYQALGIFFTKISAIWAFIHWDYNKRFHSKRPVI